MSPSDFAAWSAVLNLVALVGLLAFLAFLWLLGRFKK